MQKLKDMKKEDRGPMIASFEQIFMILFLIGLLSLNVMLTAQYPMLGVMEMLVGVLLFFMAKFVRKKYADQEAAEEAKPDVEKGKAQ